MINLYELVMEQLSMTQLTFTQIALGSGESKRTVEKIAYRNIADPGVSHIQNLADFFHDLEAQLGANQREKFKTLMAKRARARQAA